MAISLASIQKGGVHKPPIMILHGSPGIGKTTFGASAPSPIFVRTEDGLGILEVDAFPVAESWGEVVDAMGALFSESSDYKTLVVDSLSALEPLIWQQVAKDTNKENIEEVGYGKGYIMALDYWGQFLSGIIALRDQHNITPILIAHSEVVRFDSPEVEPYDRYQLSLHKRAFSLFYERTDIIGFAQYQTIVAKTDVGFKKKVTRGLTTGERLLHLAEKPAYIAKNRYGLPETIRLSWADFSEAIQEAWPKKKDESKD